MRFSIAARLKSFRFAFAGIAYMLRTQHNAWLHLLATIVVLAAGFALNVSAEDWRWLVAAIVLVWTAEAVNTAFEHLAMWSRRSSMPRCKSRRTSPPVRCSSASSAL